MKPLNIAVEATIAWVTELGRHDDEFHGDGLERNASRLAPLLFTARCTTAPG